MACKVTAAEAKKLGVVKKKAKERKYKEPKSEPYFFFEALCALSGLPEPKREFVFHSERKWRFDFAWYSNRGDRADSKYRVALEVDGGVWIKGGGRHNRGVGYIKDMEKLNEAALLGWVVIRCTPAQLQMGKDGPVIGWLQRAFG